MRTTVAGNYLFSLSSPRSVSFLFIDSPNCYVDGVHSYLLHCIRFLDPLRFFAVSTLKFKADLLQNLVLNFFSEKNPTQKLEDSMGPRRNCRKKIRVRSQICIF